VPNPVELADTENQSCGTVHDDLKPIQLVLRHAGQQAVAVVNSGDYKAVGYCFAASIGRALTELFMRRSWWKHRLTR